MYISYLTADTAMISPLRVESETDTGYLYIKTPDQRALRINRYHLTTPVQVCDQCQKPVVLKRVIGSGICVLCPDHTQHQAKACFSGAINPALNRKSRRELTRSGYRYRSMR